LFKKTLNFKQSTDLFKNQIPILLRLFEKIATSKSSNRFRVGSVSETVQGSGATPSDFSLDLVIFRPI